MKFFRLRIGLLVILLLVSVRVQAATEIQFWHSMDGALGEALQQLTDAFNAAQSDYKVVPVYKGSYDEAVGAVRAAFLEGKSPHIVQIYDLGTANLIASKQIIKPVHEVLKETGVHIPSDAYAPAAWSYYADSKGRLMGLPFNVSTPVLFYNRDLLKRAGVEPDSPITTWYDLQKVLLAVRQSGAAPCGLTTTMPSWVLLENTLVWHSQEFATRNNGFDGTDARLTFNTRLAIRHISLLSSWIKSTLFTYAGRREEGQALFVRGDCAFLTASSAAYADIRKSAGFDFGVLPMPYYDDINNAPYNTAVGGAGIWVMAGKKPAEYKGVAKFLAYLAKPETQAAWHQQTGYLPLSRAAYELTKKSGFYDEHPGTEIAVQTVTHASRPTAHSRGIRLGNYALIRAIIEEELEAVWASVKSPKAALDTAVQRGNEVLRRFERGANF